LVRKSEAADTASSNSFKVTGAERSSRILTRAIVRPPSLNFSDGLTTVSLGLPVYEIALKQHAAYCIALEDCGLTVTTLEADPRYPDSTFVEDTAVLTESGAMLMRPGAPSRQGEVQSIGEVLRSLLPAAHLQNIQAPGTVDGGDICEAGNHFFIGISQRTNQAGAEQLAAWLALSGFTSSFIDIREETSLLHLKSGLAYLGENRLVVTEAFAQREEFAGYEHVPVRSTEEYGANCVRINDYVLIPSGCVKLRDSLERSGYRTIALEMSEFQKMDGGLSCLSLRF
jgi:dimethylargininase